MRWSFHTPLFLFFLVLALSLTVTSVLAVDSENQVDLNNFPARLAEGFNISVFAGGILASVFLIFIFVLPVAYLGKGNFLPSLLIGLPLFGLCIVLGWLPYWFLLILSMLIALMFSNKFREILAGRM